MSEIFKTILSLSCSGALLILIFFLLRPLFQKHMSKCWQYYIWMAVVARLLLPFSLEINLMETIFHRFDQGFEQTELVTYPDRSKASAPLNGIPGYSRQKNHEERSERGNSQNQKPMIQNSHILLLCWLVISLILLIRKITVYQCFVKYIRAGSGEVEDIGLLEQFGKLIGQCKVKTTVELYTNKLISTPLLIGFFRPCIVLPTEELSASEFRYTILHELTHYKRGDMFYKWLVQTAVCVHWFNPLVCLMSRKVEQACELSCDEAVIKDLDEQERRVYGDTLLNAIGKGGSYKNSIASVTLGESRDRLKERLDAIKSFQRKPKPVLFFPPFLTLSICFGTAAMGVYAAGPLSDYKAASLVKPRKIGDLFLVEKQYTMEELERLSITNILVNTLSDEISIVRGGDTLRFEYYAQNPEEYTLEPQGDFFSGILEGTMSLTRFQASKEGGERSVTITIPEQFQLEELIIITTSGNISLTDCSAKDVNLRTQNGKIEIYEGIVYENFTVFTIVGNVLVSGTSLPDSSRAGSNFTTFDTESGTVIFQPDDSAENYCYSIDYGEEAELMINGEGIEKGHLVDSGDKEQAETLKRLSGEFVAGEKAEYIKDKVFTLNEASTAKIIFKSLRGKLLVQEK